MGPFFIPTMQKRPIINNVKIKEILKYITIKILKNPQLVPAHIVTPVKVVKITSKTIYINLNETPKPIKI